MREFTNIIEKELRSGLSPDVRAYLSFPFLRKAMNMVSTEYGITEHRRPQLPLSLPLDIQEYGIPQIFYGRDNTILAYPHQLFLVDTSVHPWECVPIHMKDVKGSPINIHGKNKWHFVDLGKSWYMFNGFTSVFKDYGALLDFDSPTVYVSRDVTPISGAYAGGRILVAGFSRNPFAVPDWEYVFDSWEDELTSEIPFSFDFGEKTVLWSSIGGGDFPLWLFFPERAINPTLKDVTEIDALNTPFIDTEFYQTLLRNDFGFIDIDTPGRVLGVKNHGDEFVVFSTHSVDMMFKSLNNDATSATLGQRNLIRQGLYRRDAYGGDEAHTIFVSTSGDLYRITQEGATLLGYRKQMEQVINDDFLDISYEASENVFYISNGDKTFILSNNGLTETDTGLSSIKYYMGSVLGIVNEPDEIMHVVETGIMDLSIRGIKTVTALNLGIDAEGDVYTRIGFRYTKKDEFQYSKEVILNKESNSVHFVSGLEFTIRVRSKEPFRLDNIQVKWQASDKRQIRGTYVSTSTTREGE